MAQVQSCKLFYLDHRDLGIEPFLPYQCCALVQAWPSARGRTRGGGIDIDLQAMLRHLDPATRQYSVALGLDTIYGARRRECREQQ
jgi:hypothetical protein